MLLSFSVENFRSFRDRQTLDLRASSQRPAFSWLEKAAVLVGKETEALRVKAVYGSNASGKSNLMLALITMLEVAVDSAQEPNLLLSVDPFAFGGDAASRLSMFELSFTCDDQHYLYGFKTDGDQIVKEWLYDTTIRKAKIFEREQKEVTFNKKYFGYPDAVELLTQRDNLVFRENATLLSALGSFTVGGRAQQIIDYFSGSLIGVNGDSKELYQLSAQAMLDAEMRAKVEELLASAGIKLPHLVAIDRDNVKDVNLPSWILQNLTARDQRFATLAVYTDEKDTVGNMPSWFTDMYESEGTQKLLNLAPFIIKVIQSGGVLVLDEFEAKLHPKLSREIVSMFNSATGNPNNAQFIFATHDTNLLDKKLLRRDQISFVEKGEDRASVVYSLSDVRGTRKDDDFEQDYLDGAYGAVPEITDLNIAILDD